MFDSVEMFGPAMAVASLCRHKGFQNLYPGDEREREKEIFLIFVPE